MPVIPNPGDACPFCSAPSWSSGGREDAFTRIWYQCPVHIKKIDAAMAGASLSQEQMAEVHRLRDEGQKLHSEGKHQASMEALAKAEKMLGL